MSKKIGLVLSGGGARGIAHIGVLIALEEMGIRPDVIAGTSAGAIAAAYYAAGLSPREMLEIVKSTGFVSLFRPTLLSAGFINSHRIARTHLQYLPATFAELKIPIYVTATNINVGKPKHFHEGELVKAVNASLAIPIIFAPVEIDGYQYLDGGIMNNFPVEPLVEHENCDILIGVDVNAINYMEDVSSKLSVMERIFFMAINSHASARKKAVDILIVPPDMGHFGFFDVGKANQMVEAGYQATRTILAEYDGLVASE